MPVLKIPSITSHELRLRVKKERMSILVRYVFFMVNLFTSSSDFLYGIHYTDYVTCLYDSHEMMRPLTINVRNQRPG